MKKEFVSDLNFPEIYEAVLIRGEVIGKIKEISVPELPDGISFFSVHDINGEKEIQIFNYRIPVFACSKIEYPGQAVGILVGAEKAELLELAKLFEVKVFDKNTSDQQNKNTDAPDCSILSERTLEFGDCDKIFTEAEEQSNDACSSSLDFESRYHNRSEPACIKVVHSKKNSFDVYLATQWPYSVAESLARVLDIPKNNITINSTNFAEHMNSLVWFPALMSCQAAVAANASGKNISLSFSRSDDYRYTTSSPHVIVKHKTVVDNLGKFSAMAVELVMYAGAFNPVIDEMILQILTVAVSIYDIPNLRVHVIAYKTPDKPTDFFSGLGENYILNALEKHINEIALQKDISPIEIRLLNINSENKKVGGKISLSGVFDFDELLKDVCGASDYNRKYYSNKFLNEQRYESQTRKRGIGLSTGLQCSGINSFIKRGINYSVEMTITTDGNALVTIFDCTDDLKKMFSKKISAKLGIDEANIKFIDADEKDFNIIKTMENNILYLSGLIDKCCDAIARQRFRKPLPITVTRKFQLTKNKNWDPETLEGIPFVSQTPGACVVELELDPLLYRIKVKNIWLSVAPGAVLQKQSVIEKIKKEIQNSISQLTIENASAEDFLQFRLLNVTDAPSIHVFILQSDDKDSIYKGVENIAYNLVPAAFASALEQIFIHNTDISFSMPVTREKVYKKIIEIKAHEIEKQKEEELHAQELLKEKQNNESNAANAEATSDTVDTAEHILIEQTENSEAHNEH